MVFPHGELKETTGTPPYYVDEDYPAGPKINESLPELSSWCGSESPSLEIDVYIWRYAPIVVHVRNEWTVLQDWLAMSKLSSWASSHQVYAH